MRRATITDKSAVVRILQVSGDSAKMLSETFGKIMQDRQSMSINSSDTSISKSTQMDYAIPASKIATLSSGEFVGIVADSSGAKIPQKMFHGEIQNDHDGISREEAVYKPLPLIQVVTEEDIRENYMRVKKEVQNLMELELKRIKESQPQKSKKRKNWDSVAKPRKDKKKEQERERSV